MKLFNTFGASNSTRSYTVTIYWYGCVFNSPSLGVFDGKQDRNTYLGFINVGNSDTFTIYSGYLLLDTGDGYGVTDLDGLTIVESYPNYEVLIKVDKDATITLTSEDGVSV